jgi:hypothetical protein
MPPAAGVADRAAGILLIPGRITREWPAHVPESKLGKVVL